MKSNFKRYFQIRFYRFAIFIGLIWMSIHSSAIVKSETCESGPDQAKMLCHGKGEGGGGHSLKGHMLDSAIWHPEESAAFKNYLARTYRNAFGTTEDPQGLSVFKAKNWYLIDERVNLIDLKNVGVSYDKTHSLQIGFQTTWNIQTDSSAYNNQGVMEGLGLETDFDRAYFVLHETVMIFYLLKFGDNDNFYLSVQDYEVIRKITKTLFERGETISKEEIDELFSFENGFDRQKLSFLIKKPKVLVYSKVARSVLFQIWDKGAGSFNIEKCDLIPNSSVDTFEGHELGPCVLLSKNWILLREYNLATFNRNYQQHLSQIIIERKAMNANNEAQAAVGATILGLLSGTVIQDFFSRKQNLFVGNQTKTAGEFLKFIRFERWYRPRALSVIMVIYSAFLAWNHHNLSIPSIETSLNRNDIRLDAELGMRTDDEKALFIFNAIETAFIQTLNQKIGSD